MKTIVAYMSRTGNTKKVAEAIFEEITDDKEIMNIDEVETLDGYDLSFLGFPIHQMGPDKKTVNLLKRHCINGRNIVLFITHAAPEDSPDLPPMLDKFRHAACGANILDMFDCQGELAKGIKRIMSIMPDARLRRWAKQDNSQGQPDQTRIEKAHAFSKDIMNKFHKTNESLKSENQKEESGILVLSIV